jgi:UrcA family protein
MKITTKLLNGAAVSVVSLACAAAYAQSPSRVGFERSSQVQYSDLNLSQHRDVAKLYTRILFAADQVCGPRSLTGIHYKWADYTSCYNDTVAQTVARVGNSSLSVYFQQQSPQLVSANLSVARQ